MGPGSIPESCCTSRGGGVGIGAWVIAGPLDTSVLYDLVSYNGNDDATWSPVHAAPPPSASEWTPTAVSVSAAGVQWVLTTNGNVYMATNSPTQ